MDYRSRSWRRKGQANTIPAKTISHKLNMITAIDTDGKIYLSVTQLNTDSDMMMTFMSRLALTLS